MPRAVTGCAQRLENTEKGVVLKVEAESPLLFRLLCWNVLHKGIGGDLQSEGFKRSLHTVNIHLEIAPHVAPAHAIEPLTASCKTGQRLFPGSSTKSSPSAFNLLI